MFGAFERWQVAVGPRLTATAESRKLMFRELGAAGEPFFRASPISPEQNVGSPHRLPVEVAVVALSSILALFLVAASGADTPPKPVPALVVVADFELGDTLRDPIDIRFVAPNRVWITSVKGGVHEIEWSAAADPPSVRPAPVSLTKVPWLFWHLALGAENAVVGGPFHTLHWGPRTPAGLNYEEDFAEILDLDISGTRLAVLGARRSPGGDLAPEGAITWLGRLTPGLTELAPLLFARGGAGAETLDACAPLGIGALRFATDGSLLVVPGVEPGAFLYGSDGKLIRVWDSKALGFFDNCGSVSFEEKHRLSADMKVRTAWLNSRATAEEALFLPTGLPGIIVRTVVETESRWHLLTLGRDGTFTRGELPIRSKSNQTHLRADVSGSRLALLLREVRHHLDPVQAKARLVVLEVKGSPP